MAAKVSLLLPVMHLAELGVNGVVMVGVAKGKERKAGWERLFKPGEPGARHAAA